MDPITDVKIANKIQNKRHFENAQRNDEEAYIRKQRDGITSSRNDILESNKILRTLYGKQTNELLKQKGDPTDKYALQYKKFRELNNIDKYIAKKDFENEVKSAKIATESFKRPTEFASMVRFNIESYFLDIDNELNQIINDAYVLRNELDGHIGTQNVKQFKRLRVGEFNSGKLVLKYNTLIAYIKSYSSTNTLTLQDKAILDERFSALLPNLVKIKELGKILHYTDIGIITKMYDQIQNNVYQIIPLGARSVPEFSEKEKLQLLQPQAKSGPKSQAATQAEAEALQKIDDDEQAKADAIEAQEKADRQVITDAQQQAKVVADAKKKNKKAVKAKQKEEADEHAILLAKLSADAQKEADEHAKMVEEKIAHAKAQSLPVLKAAYAKELKGIQDRKKATDQLLRQQAINLRIAQAKQAQLAQSAAAKAATPSPVKASSKAKKTKP